MFKIKYILFIFLFFSYNMFGMDLSGKREPDIANTESNNFFIIKWKKFDPKNIKPFFEKLIEAVDYENIKKDCPELEESVYFVYKKLLEDYEKYTKNLNISYEKSRHSYILLLNQLQAFINVLKTNSSKKIFEEYSVKDKKWVKFIDYKRPNVGAYAQNLMNKVKNIYVEYGLLSSDMI